MENPDPQVMLQQMLQPWHQSVEAPDSAQQLVLERFLQDYAQTAYGQQYGATKVQGIDAFRQAFPVVTYDDLKPTIERVMAGRCVSAQVER
jgi:hypothetical protein